MKCKKKYLSLILLMSITSSIFVGCSNEKTPYDKMVESTTSTATDKNLNATDEDTDENLNATDEDVDEKMISKEEALELVKKEVHKIFPNAKLKNESDKYQNSNGFYIIKYDTPYCTTAVFAVDPYTGNIQSYDIELDEYLDMDKWAENINKYFDKTIYKQTTGQEAMAKFVSRYNNNMSAENMAWTQLSDSQLNNFELVSNELVEYMPGQCAWVFRYPMEEEHVIEENSNKDDCTRRNAVNKNDKYGYMIAEPVRLDSSDKSSLYFSHVCDWSGANFYWEEHSETEIETEE